MHSFFCDTCQFINLFSTSTACKSILSLWQLMTIRSSRKVFWEPANFSITPRWKVRKANRHFPWTWRIFVEPHVREPVPTNDQHTKNCPCSLARARLHTQKASVQCSARIELKLMASHVSPFYDNQRGCLQHRKRRSPLRGHLPALKPQGPIPSLPATRRSFLIKMTNFMAPLAHLSFQSDIFKIKFGLLSEKLGHCSDTVTQGAFARWFDWMLI